MSKATDEWRVAVIGPDVYASMEATYDATRASTFRTLVERIFRASGRVSWTWAVDRSNGLDAFVEAVATYAERLADEYPAEHKVRGFAAQLRALHRNARRRTHA